MTLEDLQEAAGRAVFTGSLEGYRIDVEPWGHGTEGLAAVSFIRDDRTVTVPLAVLPNAPWTAPKALAITARRALGLCADDELALGEKAPASHCSTCFLNMSRADCGLARFNTSSADCPCWCHVEDVP